MLFTTDCYQAVPLIQEAIEMHLQGLLEQGEDIPPPSSSIEFVNVAAQKSVRFTMPDSFLTELFTSGISAPRLLVRTIVGLSMSISSIFFFGLGVSMALGNVGSGFSIWQRAAMVLLFWILGALSFRFAYKAIFSGSRSSTIQLEL